MRGKGNYFIVNEPASVPPYYTGRPDYDLTTVVIPSERPGRPVPYIKVILRPAPDFCPGMAYDQMETDDLSVPEQEADLEIFPMLIEYLEAEGETPEATLESMRAGWRWIHGLHTPNEGIDPDYGER